MKGSKKRAVKPGSIEVVNIKEGCNYYCGCKKHYKTCYGVDMSVLSNPFYISDESQRDNVCNRYEKYITNKLHGTGRANMGIQLAINKLVNDYTSGIDIRLGCTCAPKRCHCDTIKRIVLDKVADMDKVASMVDTIKENAYQDIGLLLITVNKWIYETPLPFSKLHDIVKKSGFNLCNPTELSVGTSSIYADECIAAIYKSTDVFPNLTLYTAKTLNPKINKIVLFGDILHNDDKGIDKQLNDAVSTLCRFIKSYEIGENSDKHNNRVLQLDNRIR